MAERGLARERTPVAASSTIFQRHAVPKLDAFVKIFAYQSG